MSLIRQSLKFNYFQCVGIARCSSNKLHEVLLLYNLPRFTFLKLSDVNKKCYFRLTSPSYLLQVRMCGQNCLI